jgi:hypothetical protein
MLKCTNPKEKHLAQLALTHTFSYKMSHVSSFIRVTGYGMDNLRFIPSMVMDTVLLVCVALPPLSYTSLGMILKQRNNFTLCVYKYEGYPEINFRSHVEHEVVGAARRGCTAV